MHGFGTIGDVFFFLIIYGFIIPLVVFWLCLFTVLHVAPRFFQVGGVIAHVVAAYWSFSTLSSVFILSGIIACMMLYLSIYQSFYNRLLARQNLYAREVPVIQPNELKR